MRVSWKLLLWIWMAGFGSLQAQTCEGQLTTWSHPGSKPSFLALITGHFPRPSAATWEMLAGQQAKADIAGSRAATLLHAGKPVEALQLLEPQLRSLLQDSVADSTMAIGRMNDLEVGAMAALADGKLDRAGELLSRALWLPNTPNRCRLRTEQLLVSYLKAYGTETPLFPNFNSGFYNYLSDSLKWNPKEPDSNGYLMALNVVALAYQLDAQRQALYMELLGDLLSKEPNRFNANYMSALAYLRAGMVAGEGARAAYDRKAIFALEAPRQAEYRFNQYRFTQLRKALQEDVDSAAARQATAEAADAQAIQAGKDPLTRFGGQSSEALVSATFEDTDPGKLPQILKKSRAQLEARNDENKRYAGDVDLKKEVKKDSRFNAFALFLILTIVASVVILWRKVRKGSAR